MKKHTCSVYEEHTCVPITNKKIRVFKINKYCILNCVLENVENINNLRNNMLQVPISIACYLISFRHCLQTVLKL